MHRQCEYNLEGKGFPKLGILMKLPIYGFELTVRLKVRQVYVCMHMYVLCMYIYVYIAKPICLYIYSHLCNIAYCY